MAAAAADRCGSEPPDSLRNKELRVQSEKAEANVRQVHAGEMFICGLPWEKEKAGTSNQRDARIPTSSTRP